MIANALLMENDIYFFCVSNYFGHLISLLFCVDRHHHKSYKFWFSYADSYVMS